MECLLFGFFLFFCPSNYLMFLFQSSTSPSTNGHSSSSCSSVHHRDTSLSPGHPSSSPSGYTPSGYTPSHHSYTPTHSSIVAPACFSVGSSTPDYYHTPAVVGPPVPPPGISHISSPYTPQSCDHIPPVPARFEDAYILRLQGYSPAQGGSYNQGALYSSQAFVGQGLGAASTDCIDAHNNHISKFK